MDRILFVLSVRYAIVTLLINSANACNQRKKNNGQQKAKRMLNLFLFGGRRPLSATLVTNRSSPNFLLSFSLSLHTRLLLYFCVFISLEKIRNCLRNCNTAMNQRCRRTRSAERWPKHFSTSNDSNWDSWTMRLNAS